METLRGGVARRDEGGKKEKKRGEGGETAMTLVIIMIMTVISMVFLTLYICISASTVTSGTKQTLFIAKFTFSKTALGRISFKPIVGARSNVHS